MTSPLFAYLRIAFKLFTGMGILLVISVVSSISSPANAVSMRNTDTSQQSTIHSEWKKALLKGKKVALSDSNIQSLTQGHVYSGQYVVAIVKGTLTSEKIQSIIQIHGSSVPSHQQNQQKAVGKGKYLALKVPENKTVEGFLAELNEDSNILFAEPSYKRALSWIPNDTSFPQQWQLQNSSGGNYGIEMPKAWDYMFSQTGNYGGASDVVVAVIDTGLAYENRTVAKPDTYEDTWDFDPIPDLPLRIWTNPGETAGDNLDNDGNGYIDDYNGVNIDDYYNYEYSYGGHTAEDGYPDDDYGHGTHVSNIIAGKTNNATAGAGIAFNVQIMPIKIFDAVGNVWSESVIDALAYAIENGADVINMSFGGASPSTVEDALADEAVALGIIPVAASGNSANNIVQYPAGYDNVIAVGASNPNGTRSWYSTYGDWIDLVAPVGSSGSGDGFQEQNYQCFNLASQSNPLPCTEDNTGTWYPGGATPNSFKNFSVGASQGTSFASPQVAAVAALIKSGDPEITFAEARQKLRMGSTSVSGVRYSSQLGYGILNAYGSFTTTVAIESYRSGAWNWSADQTKFLTSGDYNGDGKEDMANLYDYGNSDIGLLVFASDGNLFSATNWFRSGMWNWSVFRTKFLTSGDFNADGRDDIAVLYDYGNNDMGILVFTSNGNSFSLTSWYRSGIWNWSVTQTKQLASGDFNADGKDDLATMYDYGRNDMGILVFTSNGNSFSLTSWYRSGIWNWSVTQTKQLASGDFNADGKDDLATMYDYGRNDMGILVFPSNSNSFSFSSWYRSGIWNWSITQTKQLASGDFNADGKDDLATMYDYGSNDMGILTFPSGGSSFSLANWYRSGEGNWSVARTKFLTAGEYGGNGIDEIGAMYDYGNNDMGILIFR